MKKTIKKSALVRMLDFEKEGLIFTSIIIVAYLLWMILAPGTEPGFTKRCLIGLLPLILAMFDSFLQLRMLKKSEKKRYDVEYCKHTIEKINVYDKVALALGICVVSPLLVLFTLPSICCMVSSDFYIMMSERKHDFIIIGIAIFVVIVAILIATYLWHKKLLRQHINDLSQVE